MSEEKFSVSERLADLGAIFEDRNRIYGDQYKQFGKVMMILIGPTKIENADDYNRIMTVFNMQTKLARYCKQFSVGGHTDSLDDLAVYSQMLQELDADLSDTRNIATASLKETLKSQTRTTIKGALEPESNTPEEEMIDYERIFLNDKR